MTNKKPKHIFLKIFIGFAVAVCMICIAAVSYYFVITAGTKLDQSKINNSASVSVNFASDTGEKLSSNQMFNKGEYATYSEINKHTIDAFVSAEDKRFFSHNGVDYLRIMGAIKNNILHPNRKQGGSTITQQVIKNTQLTSEKTINRKLKELKLARQLEKKYSKEQILETYLNSIYFGNGCYGIQNASRYYFNKPVSEISIAESALLASTINAPTIYDPVSRSEKANERKELILKLMLNNNKINTQQYNESIAENIKIAKSVKNYKNQYFKGVIAETCNILKVTESQLKNMEITVQTYYNPEIQDYLEELITSGSYTTSNNTKIGSIILDNKTKGIIAYASSSGLDLNTYRQPGSTIKPILVYAPAFETGKYSPASFILDEPININGYTPENANKTYSGMVNLRSAISRSLNIPAVKVLDDIGINNAKYYANMLGINFEKNDNNLALALGGFTKGTTIKQLADGYMCFANGGQYCKSAFINKIFDNNKEIYSRNIFLRKAISDATAYLVSDCLKETVTNGTAKRMADLNLPICAKTGTVGNSSGNTDAYNISYSSEHTLCTWIGSYNKSEPMQSTINGATYPTLFNKNIFTKLYTNGYKPQDFTIPESIEKVGLNAAALKEYKLEKDDQSSITDIFNINYLPPQTARTNLDTTLTINNYENSKPIINFTAKRDNIYNIYRQNGNNLQFLQKIEFTNGNVTYVDNTAVNGTIYEYYVEAKNGNNSKISNKIKLLAN